jgi:4-amino-4-deoxy-L-arabinose transferase-like glycosyltransferase
MFRHYLVPVSVIFAILIAATCAYMHRHEPEGFLGMDDLAGTGNLSDAPAQQTQAPPVRCEHRGAPSRPGDERATSVTPRLPPAGAGAILLAVLALAFAGQRLLVAAQPSERLPLGGLGLIALAVGLLLALIEWRSTSSWWASIGGRSPTSWQAVAALTTLSTAILATSWSQAPTHQRAALLLWLGSCVALLLAGVDKPRWSLSLAGLRQGTRVHAREAIALATCLGVALAARAAALDTIPPVLGGDEASMGLEARSILRGEDTRMFVTGWLGHPRLSFALMAATMRVWGDGIVGLRMHAALVGTITLLPLYFLVRPSAGSLAAQGAVWLLATMPFHIHFSRVGTNNIEDGLIMGSLFLALLWASRSGRALGWIATGMIAAMGMYMYPGARITPVFVAGFAAAQTLHTRGAWLRRHGYGLLVCTAAFLIVAAPMLRFYLTHWDDFNARLNEVGIFQSGWLREEVARTGRSPLLIVFDQVQRSLLSVIFYRDQTVWYNDTTAMLQFWPAMFFPFGLVLCLLSWKRPLPLVLLLWFFGTTLIGGALTESAPSYARLGGVAPALAAILALGIQALGRLAHRLHLCSRRASAAAALVLIAFLSLGGLHHYFVRYTPQYLYGSLNGELATSVGGELARLPAGTRVYFLGVPRMYYGFATIPFLAPHLQGTDLEAEVTVPPADYMAAAPAFFFAVPEREPELRRIQEALPGGTWIARQRAVNDDVLWYGYHLPPAAP